MSVDTFQQLPVARSVSPADAELAEDRARQAGLSRVMHETKGEGVQAERAQRQQMVDELAVQREERDHERTEDAIAAAESEGMPPRPVLPLTDPAASGHTQHRWGFVRHTGWLAAGLTLLSLVVAGGVFLVRQRCHQQTQTHAWGFPQRVKAYAQTHGGGKH